MWFVQPPLAVSDRYEIRVNVPGSVMTFAGLSQPITISRRTIVRVTSSLPAAARTNGYTYVTSVVTSTAPRLPSRYVIRPLVFTTFPTTRSFDGAKRLKRSRGSCSALGVRRAAVTYVRTSFWCGFISAIARSGRSPRSTP